MSDSRKYYVISDDNCKFESMTKEEIIAAIVEYMESHEITDVDTGFVTTLKEQNRGVGLKFWVGTQAEYNALETHEPNCFYIIADDTTVDDLEEAVAGLQTAVEAITGKNGDILLNETVTYGSCFVDLSGEHPLSDFSIVKVALESGYEALCSVENSSGDSIYITGTGVMVASTSDDVFMCAINLTCSKELNKLTANYSVNIVIDTTGNTLSGTAIKKITGIC